MSGADERQQQEAEEARLRQELEALAELERRGLHDLATFFAADLGITKEFQREICNG